MLSALRSKILTLKKHQGFRRYAANTSWMMAEKILRMFVGLFVGVWIARYLGPEQFGLLSYAQSFVFLFGIVATLGIDNIVVRDLVKNKQRIGEIIGTAFYMKLAGALLAVSLLCLSLFMLEANKYEAVVTVIISLSLVFQSLNVVDFYFQSKVLSKYVAYSNSLSLFFVSFAKVVLIFGKAPLIAFAFVTVVEVALVVAGYIYFYSRCGQSLCSWKFDLKYSCNLLRESLPLIMAGAVNSAYMKIDQIMIKEFLDNFQAGLYAAAVRLSEAWFGIGVLICNSLFPALVNGKERGRDIYIKRLTKLFVFLVFICYAVCLAALLFSEQIVTLLFGTAYLSSASVLVIHIFSTIFVYLGVASGRWLIIEEKAAINFYRNLVGVLLNIILNVYLIRMYGIVGAAYASLASYILAFYMFDIFLKDTRRCFFYKTRSLLLLTSKA